MESNQERIDELAQIADALHYADILNEGLPPLAVAAAKAGMAMEQLADALRMEQLSYNQRRRDVFSKN